MLGKVIFSSARRWSKSRPSEGRKRKTEKARWSRPEEMLVMRWPGLSTASHHEASTTARDERLISQECNASSWRRTWPNVWETRPTCLFRVLSVGLVILIHEDTPLLHQAHLFLVVRVEADIGLGRVERYCGLYQRGRHACGKVSACSRGRGSSDLGDERVWVSLTREKDGMWMRRGKMDEWKRDFFQTWSTPWVARRRTTDIAPCDGEHRCNHGAATSWEYDACSASHLHVMIQPYSTVLMHTLRPPRRNAKHANASVVNTWGGAASESGERWDEVIPYLLP